MHAKLSEGYACLTNSEAYACLTNSEAYMSIFASDIRGRVKGLVSSGTRTKAIVLLKVIITSCSFSDGGCAVGNYLHCFSLYFCRIWTVVNDF